jgi:hypothetical protein
VPMDIYGFCIGITCKGSQINSQDCADARVGDYSRD